MPKTGDASGVSSQALGWACRVMVSNISTTPPPISATMRTFPLPMPQPRSVRVCRSDERSCPTHKEGDRGNDSGSMGIRNSDPERLGTKAVDLDSPTAGNSELPRPARPSLAAKGLPVEGRAISVSARLLAGLFQPKARWARRHGESVKAPLGDPGDDDWLRRNAARVAG